jgi:hypothetical protein
MFQEERAKLCEITKPFEGIKDFLCAILLDRFLRRITLIPEFGVSKLSELLITGHLKQSFDVNRRK